MNEQEEKKLKKKFPNIKTILKRRQRRKKGDMGYFDFFMLGFGSMVGVGWAVSSNSWIADAGGPIPAFIGFLVATLLLVPIGLCHGELLATLPMGGGVMVYTEKAFGKRMSFISSWFLALAYLTILPWEAIYVNEILTGVIPIFSGGRVLYHIGGYPIELSSIVLGVALALILFFINYKGSKFAAKLQSILSFVIIIVGVIVIAASFAKSDVNNLYPIYENINSNNHNSLFGGIVAMIVIVPFFMAGFDTIPQSIEETSPDKKFKYIATSLVLSIIAAGVFYALVIISTGSVSSWREYSLSSPPAMGKLLESAYSGSFGKALNYLVLIGTVSGLFSTWNGMFMASARLIQSMGASGLIPEFFGAKHAEYNTPVAGSILCFIFAAVGPFVGPNFINPLTSLGSVAFVIGWFLTCLSLLFILNADKDYYTSYKAKGGKFTVYLAIFISAAIVIMTFIPKAPSFMGYPALIIFFIWLGLGLVFDHINTKKSLEN